MDAKRGRARTVVFVLACLVLLSGLVACRSVLEEGGGEGTPASPGPQWSPTAEAGPSTASATAEAPSQEPSPAVALAQTTEPTPYPDVPVGASRIDSALYLGQLIWECPGGNCGEEIETGRAAPAAIEDARSWVDAECRGELMVVETEREYLYFLVPTYCGDVLSGLSSTFEGERVYIETVPNTTGSGASWRASVWSLKYRTRFFPSEGWYLPK